MSRFWKLALFVVANVATAVPASAGLLPVSATTAADGSNTRYTYGVVLTSNSTLQSGDYFTIFDFSKPIASTAVMPTGWTVSLNPLGGNPGGTVPGDSPNIPNLTYVYHGPTLTGSVGLGNFMIDSSISASTSTPYSFASFTQQTANGANESNITSVMVPVVPSSGGTTGTQGSGGTPPGVPEPSTLLLMGIGLPFLCFARRLRIKKAITA